MRPIPTIVEIQEALEADLRANLDLTDLQLKRVLLAFSGVLSAQFKLVNLFLSDIQNNIFPDTADLEALGGTLERQGRIYLGRNPNPATVGVFELSVIGEVGAILRSELTFKSNEGSSSPGQLYILDAEYELIAGANVIQVRALEAGTFSQLEIGDELTITEPVVGVNNTLTVVEVIERPSASEPVENYRQAILDAIQLEPQGGARTDYRLWSADAQGVREVYPYVRQNNAGVVDVYVEATIEDSIDGLGTPAPQLLIDTLEVIEFDPDTTRPLNERGRRPIQAIVETLPITLIPVDIIITGLNDNTAAVQDAIIQNLEAFLRNIRPFISGADLPRDKNDILFSARLQSVVTDVLEATNFFQNFEMQVQGVPVLTFEFELGNIPFLRNSTFV